MDSGHEVKRLALILRIDQCEFQNDTGRGFLLIGGAEGIGYVSAGAVVESIMIEKAAQITNRSAISSRPKFHLASS
jgi:hypothetical protein